MPKGFIKAPSLKDLQFTPQERAEFEALLAWQEQSAKSRYIFGSAIECLECHVTNNPNNAYCWHCGKRLVLCGEKGTND